MRQLYVAVTLCLAGVVGNSGTVAGDTRAPNAQTFEVHCGGSTLTIVSPVFSAKAGQVVGTTGAAVLQYAALSDGTVLFEHPSFNAHKPSALTTCTLPFPEGTITVVFLMTPQGQGKP